MIKLWIAFTGLCMLLLVACKDEVDGPIILIHSFDVALVDKLGNDLLDPNVDNHYEPERIRIYKIVANVEDEIHGDGLSYVPDGACFVPVEEQKEAISNGCQQAFLISISAVYEDAIVNGQSRIVVKWNEAEQDTIVCDIDPDWCNNIRSVYVNGVCKWTYKDFNPILGPQSIGSPGVRLVK